MKKFRKLPLKEKIEYIMILMIYPFLMLFHLLSEPMKRLGKMKKQVIAGSMAVVMLLTMIPMTAFATSGNDIRYGDVNSDEKIDLKDVLTFRKYNAEQAVTFDSTAADVNADKTADSKDLLILKKYLAGWNVWLGPKLCSITFNTDGGSAVETQQVRAGYTLDEVPKTSKEGFLFTGWYTEDGQQFYGEDEIVGDLALVAHYEKMAPAETLNITTFTKMDQTPDLSFVLKSTEALTTEQVSALLTLEVKDGSDPVELHVADDGNGAYTVSAVGGYNEGSSYTLTLGEGLVFDGKEETIRNASFSIVREEVANLTVRDDLIFIQDTPEMTYTLSTLKPNDKPLDVLDIAAMNSDTTALVTGSFDYNGELKAGDILCIYEETDPRERDPLNENYNDDSVAYIKVSGKTGTTVSFTSLDEEEAKSVLFLPDALPFKAKALPTGATGTVDINTYDREAWTGMGLTLAPKADIGDFVVLYTDDFSNITDDSVVYYGEVTAVNGDTITYKETTQEKMQKSMDFCANNEIPGSTILEHVDVEAVEADIQRQFENSSFAEDSVKYLADAAMMTDSVRDIPALQSAKLTKSNGEPLTAAEMRSLGLSGEISLTDDVKVKVELGDSSKYFDDGIRLAVGLSAEFSVDIGKDAVGELKFTLNATFVEEIALDVNVNVNSKWAVIVPTSIRVNTTIDVKNYTGISFEIMVYSVAKEEDNGELWDEFSGLKETFDKIDLLKEWIDKATGTVEQINGYKEDLKLLQQKAESSGGETTLRELAETFQEMNVTEDLMNLLGLSNETELDAGVKDLMQQYCDLLGNECEWTKLFSKEIFTFSFSPDGMGIIQVSINIDFVVSTKVNVALGLNMEYVIGKRYSFWFDVIKFTSGSAQLDIMDERFAFQFYVMGALGIRIGPEMEVCVGIFSTKLNSVGIEVGFGPVVEVYGYFIYEYSKMRPMGDTVWQYDEQMSGALYFEFGVYFEIKFRAQAGNGKFEYNPTLVSVQLKLFSAGTRKSVYDFENRMEDDAVVRIVDKDEDTSNGYAMKLPENYQVMKYVDLREGYLASAQYLTDKFNYQFSSKYFTVDAETGVITVKPPLGASYLECDLTLTWKNDKLAFRSKDLTSTVHLVWTNLSDAELKEPFTASIRVGNATDGYDTVWSRAVYKNQPFSLPTHDETLKLMNYDSYETALGNLKYSDVTGFGDQKTTDLTVNGDTTYYFETTPRKYSIAIAGVENADGSKTSQTFTAKYGEAFDLSSLSGTGTDNDKTKTYTAFYEITAQKDGAPTSRVVTEAIGRSFAQELLFGGTTYTANYVDNSVGVTYQFIGVDLAPITLRVKRGSVPPDVYSAPLERLGKMAKQFNPAVGPVQASTVYTVLCGNSDAPKHTLTFATNGGSDIAPLNVFEGAAIYAPNPPTKTGYVFDGWYSDKELTQPYTFTTMPKTDVTLYAKWRASEITVTFDANEGNLSGAASKSVAVGKAYGELPTASRTDGYRFIGWFTAKSGGTQITKDTVCNTVIHQTLYAQWYKLQTIDLQVDFQSVTYNKNPHRVVYTGSELNDLNIRYRVQNSDVWQDEAVNAGVYDVSITRAEDNDYVAFDKTYYGAMTIEKGTRTLDASQIQADPSATGVFLELTLDDLRGEVVYSTPGGYSVEGGVTGLKPNTKYTIKASVKNDPNYFDCEGTGTLTVTTLGAPTEKWTAHADTSWYKYSIKNYTITTPEQLAGVMLLAAGFEGKDPVGFNKVTINLGADIDMNQYQWEPIPLFGGIINGNGHTISGLYSLSGGLFEELDGNGSGIRDLTLDLDCYFSGSAEKNYGAFVNLINDPYVVVRNCINKGTLVASGKALTAGGIVGDGDCLMGDCVNMGAVIGTTNVGGIAGRKRQTDLDNCINQGTVIGVTRVGGIAGDLGGAYSPQIYNCVNRGTVTGTDICVGGIAGIVTSGGGKRYIKNCSNWGAVNGSASVGGIVGEIAGSAFTGEVCRVGNCYNIGKVTGNSYVGGICGRNGSNKGYVEYGYYLEGSAVAGGRAQAGAGNNDNNFTDSSHDNTRCIKFSANGTIPESHIGYSYEKNVMLLDALNAWVTANPNKGYRTWTLEGSENGYPILAGLQVEAAQTGVGAASLITNSTGIWRKQNEK